MITLLAILTKISFGAKRAFWFVIDNWKVVLPIVAVLIALVFFVRWWNRPPKLDEKAIQAAQKAIAENDRKAMVEVLAASDVQEKQIDGNLANAETEKLKAFHEARKNAEAMTNDELAAELNRRAQQ